MKEHFKKDFATLGSLYFLAVFFLVIISAFAVPIQIKRMGIFVPLNKKKEISSFYNKSSFENISIKGKSFVVYDVLSKQVIAGKNENNQYPLASITKIMTALTAVKVASLETKISVNKASLDGGYDLGLKEKQVWTLKDLLKYTLVFSSNDGAQIIADKLSGREKFVSLMNNSSKEFGLKMVFTQPAGLDIDGKIGGIGSAVDVAKMMEIARYKLDNILDSTTKTRLNVKSSYGYVSGIPNTNQYVDEFLGVEASKTGYTDSAGGNLVLSVDISLGHPVIIVVLGSTKEDRFIDAYKIYLALLNSIK